MQARVYLLNLRGKNDISVVVRISPPTFFHDERFCCAPVLVFIDDKHSGNSIYA
jgi:hypothetical protein